MRCKANEFSYRLPIKQCVICPDDNQFQRINVDLLNDQLNYNNIGSCKYTRITVNDVGHPKHKINSTGITYYFSSVLVDTDFIRQAPTFAHTELSELLSALLSAVFAASGASPAISLARNVAGACKS